MTDWHEVHDSRQERPAELDTSSSRATVYERRNIRQETGAAPMSGDAAEVTEWVYEQREYTREEYDQTQSPATAAIMAAISGLGKAVEDLGKAGGSSDAAEIVAAIERGLAL